jgi:hypothetical protein
VPLQGAQVVNAPSTTAGDAGAGCLIRALHKALYLALVPKRDGTRHHANCINRHVNASPQPCSRKCDIATGALLLAEDWSEQEGGEPVVQLRLEAS